MSDGDGHIWKVGAGPVPEAECGYSPEVREIKDGDDNVIGEEIVHADPTGQPCEECNAIASPPVVPPTEPDEPEE